MKLEYELIDESQMDIEDLQAERDLNLAAVDAIHRCRRFGASYVIEVEGKTTCIPPEQTGPYENGLLEHATRLNRRIEELQAREAGSAHLNDRPADKQ